MRFSWFFLRYRFSYPRASRFRGGCCWLAYPTMPSFICPTPSICPVLPSPHPPHKPSLRFCYARFTRFCEGRSRHRPPHQWLLWILGEKYSQDLHRILDILFLFSSIFIHAGFIFPHSLCMSFSFPAPCVFLAMSVFWLSRNTYQYLLCVRCSSGHLSLNAGQEEASALWKLLICWERQTTNLRANSQMPSDRIHFMK